MPLTPLVLLLLLAPAAEPPRHVLEGGGIKLTIDLPDAANGYYRGARFDWSGLVASAEVGGHTVFGPWKSTHDPANHDDVAGTAEEFGHDEPLGYAAAPVGGTFVKIGVGELVKPAEAKYHFSHNYKIAKPGTWKITTGDNFVEFRQVLTYPAGYGYRYVKRVEMVQAGFVIRRTLANTGTKSIDTDHYGHHFLTVDGDPVGPNYSLWFPWPPRAKDPAGLRDIADIRGDRLVYVKPLDQGQVQSQFVGFGEKAEDNRVTVEHAASGLKMSIINDRPLAKFNLWSLKTTLCPEPFVHIKIEPGGSASWSTRYQFENGKAK
jgi:hypothetical protein